MAEGKLERNGRKRSRRREVVGSKPLASLLGARLGGASDGERRYQQFAVASRREAR